MNQPQPPAISQSVGTVAEPQTPLVIRFTGSGAEYFRIWIVNLLLVLVTLTLYLPFARARRIKYFQNHTVVGEIPLGFHADPWRMFRGYLLILALGISYFLISTFAPYMGWLALLLVALGWPFMWHASLRFRLHNSSWRGVRMAFRGDLKGAYLAMLPLFIPALVFTLLIPAPLAEGEELAPEVAQRLLTVMSFVPLIALLLLPWMFVLFKRYQHGGYAFIDERARLIVSTGRAYWVFLQLLLLAILLFAVGGFAIGMVAVAHKGQEGSPAIFIAIGLLYAALFLLLMPYATTRLQNLLWSNTRSERIHFESRLDWGQMIVVTAVNWLLIVLTLGLFMPFAKVRMARLRLAAISLTVAGSVEEWLADAQVAGGHVLGDAASDYVGIDLGL